MFEPKVDMITHNKLLDKWEAKYNDLVEKLKVAEADAEFWKSEACDKGHNKQTALVEAVRFVNAMLTNINIKEDVDIGNMVLETAKKFEEYLTKE